MKENIRPAIIKIYIGNELKAKIKATANLNDMTLTELFMDALFEKYPHLLSTGKESEDIYDFINRVVKDSKPIISPIIELSDEDIQ